MKCWSSPDGIADQVCKIQRSLPWSEESDDVHSRLMEAAQNLTDKLKIKQKLEWNTPITNIGDWRERRKKEEACSESFGS